MIKINTSSDLITVRGHANYAPYDYDIVCAGVSTLVVAFVVSCGDAVSSNLQPGDAEVRIRDPDAVRDKFNMFICGAEALRSKYPAYIEMTEH